MVLASDQNRKQQRLRQDPAGEEPLLGPGPGTAGPSVYSHFLELNSPVAVVTTTLHIPHKRRQVLGVYLRDQESVPALPSHL